MKIEHDLKLDFSDVLIRPKRSTLESRNNINLEREFKFPHSKQIWKGVPIIASNMDTVGTVNMYNSLNNYNMLTCFHKFLDIDEYPENTNNNYMISIGIRDEESWFDAIKGSGALTSAGAWYTLKTDDGYEKKFQPSKWGEIIKSDEEFRSRVISIMDEEIIQKFDMRQGDAKDFYEDPEDLTVPVTA